MIRRFLELFTAPQGELNQAPDVGLAAAILMVEVMKADHQIDDSERASLLASIRTLTGRNDTDAEALLQEALSASQSANDLFRFTEAVHANWTEQQKSDLLVALWRVAFADNQLDRYEEHIIRRIADLLYVPHSEFIRTKLIARDQ